MTIEGSIEQKIVIAMNLLEAGGDQGNQLMDDPEIKQLVETVKTIYQNGEKGSETDNH